MMRLLRTTSTRNEPTQFRTRRNEGPTSGHLLLGGVDTIYAARTAFERLAKSQGNDGHDLHNEIMKLAALRLE